jgi:hypothetical protein
MVGVEEIFNVLKGFVMVISMEFWILATRKKGVNLFSWVMKGWHCLHIRDKKRTWQRRFFDEVFMLFAMLKPMGGSENDWIIFNEGYFFKYL